jgi:2,3-dihydroxyphenylpropionate 1,2-dioxygenase
VAIVIGVGASHTTLMNTHWDAVAHLDRAVTVRDGLAEANRLIRAARPDVAVVVGPNHFRGLWLDLMPAFVLGVGDVLAAGEHGTPEGPLRTDTALAHTLLETLLADEFDVAFSASLTVDHGVTHAVQYVLAGIDIPVVPLLVNAFAPPLPRLRRCTNLGRALGRVLHAADRRVAFISSGGLSHALAFPDWRAPRDDDDRYLVSSWLHGRGRWQEFEARRRGIVVGGPPRLAPDFDAEVLAAFEGGTLTRWAEQPDLDGTLADRAGNGANEIRTWLVLAGACADAPARTIAYAPVPEWKTGMAVAVVDRPREPT